MHRWSFQRLVRWLIPSLAYGIALCALIIEQKQEGGGRGLSFASDEAYRTMAVARALADRFEWGLQAGAPMIAVKNVVQPLAVALTGRVLNNFSAALAMIHALLGWGTVLLLLRMARRLFPFPPFVLYTALLLIAAPGFLGGVTRGDASLWGVALVCVVAAFYVEGMAGEESLLGRKIILALGALTLVRIEFLVLWVLVAVHAWLVALGERRRDGTLGYVSVRFFTGLFVLSLFVAPLVAWNLRVVGVPWPQMPGTPMTADVWAAAPPGEVFAQYRTHVREGVRLAFRTLAETPWMQGWLERFLTWVGALFVAGLSFFRKDERPFSVIPWLFVTTPLALGVMYPMFGDSAFPTVLGAMQPLAMLAAAFFVFRIPFLIEGIYRKLKPGLPEAPGFQVWWSVAGGLLILVTLLHSVGSIRQNVREQHITEMVRDHLRAFCSTKHSQGQTLATDAPGWLAYQIPSIPLVDVSGEGTAEILSCLTPNGRYDLNALKDFLREKGVDTVILWDSGLFDLDSDFLVQTVDWPARVASWEKLPHVYELKPPGVL